jgi:hypothetical protein
VFTARYGLMPYINQTTFRLLKVKIFAKNFHSVACHPATDVTWQHGRKGLTSNTTTFVPNCFYWFENYWRKKDRKQGSELCPKGKISYSLIFNNIQFNTQKQFPRRKFKTEHSFLSASPLMRHTQPTVQRTARALSTRGQCTKLIADHSPTSSSWMHGATPQFLYTPSRRKNIHLVSCLLTSEWSYASSYAVNRPVSWSYHHSPQTLTVAHIGIKNPPKLLTLIHTLICRSWLRHCTKSRKVAASIPDCHMNFSVT